VIGGIGLAVARKDLPLEFRLDVRGRTLANSVTATMVRLAWSLHLNDKETISGTDTTLAFPGSRPPSAQMRPTGPVFRGPAKAWWTLPPVAGLSSDPTRIWLRGVPTIDTPLGRISYPTPITIVSRTVGGPP
jgi:hypothetical protein